MSPSQWLRVIKLFELEVSARTIAKQIGVAYNTAHRAVTILRMAILAHSEDADILLSGEIELDESYSGGKRKGKRGRGAAGKVYINGLEGFWSFAKERLIKHHGMSRKFFPLYLKELEFRYNYRQQNLFNKLCQFLCDFVPDVE